MSEDPIRFLGQDPNLRRALGNNPTNLVDPTGLEARIERLDFSACPTYSVVTTRVSILSLFGLVASIDLHIPKRDTVKELLRFGPNKNTERSNTEPEFVLKCTNTSKFGDYRGSLVPLKVNLPTTEFGSCIFPTAVNVIVASADYKDADAKVPSNINWIVWVNFYYDGLGIAVSDKLNSVVPTFDRDKVSLKEAIDRITKAVTETGKFIPVDPCEGAKKNRVPIKLVIYVWENKRDTPKPYVLRLFLNEETGKYFIDDADKDNPPPSGVFPPQKK